MLDHSKMILEDGLLAINSVFDKLIIALRSAVAEENSLDKKATSYDDILNASLGMPKSELWWESKHKSSEEIVYQIHLHIQITVILNEKVMTTLLIRCDKRLSGLTSSLHSRCRLSRWAKGTG